MRPDRTYKMLFSYIYFEPDTYLLLTKLSNSNTISDVIINLTFKLHVFLFIFYLLKLMVNFYFLVANSFSSFKIIHT